MDAAWLRTSQHRRASSRCDPTPSVAPRAFDDPISYRPVAWYLCSLDGLTRLPAAGTEPDADPRYPFLEAAATPGQPAGS